MVDCGKADLISPGLLKNLPRGLHAVATCDVVLSGLYSMLTREQVTCAGRCGVAVMDPAVACCNLVAESIHFTLFGIVLLTIKLKVYILGGL